MFKNKKIKQANSFLYNVCIGLGILVRYPININDVLIECDHKLWNKL